MSKMKEMLWIALLVVSASGCDGAEASCSTDDDCFKGEACVENECADAPNGTDNSNVNGVDNANSNDDANDATNAQNSVDSNDSNNDDNGATNASTVAEGVCLVDPFTASCEPDDNDDFGEFVRFEDGSPGCNSGWDDFEGGALTIEGKQLCALEIADRYNTNLVPCDNKTFVVEVTMTPREDCDPDDYRFNVSVQGNDCDEPNDAVRCEVLDDGSKRVIAFVEPSISIASLYLDVEKTDKENVHFEYDIDVLVRE